MPLLKIQTNVEIETAQRAALMRNASQRVAALLGKSEKYVMVSLETGAQMFFAGSAEPLAYLELKSIGLPQQRTSEMCAALCKLVGDELAVPGERVYVEFTDAGRAMWGWNGGTFER